MVAAVAKRNILVVGGPTTELPEICDELAELSPRWAWQHAPSGTTAMDRLTEQTFDAVVTDLQLENLTGLQLLNQVMTQWPRTHRVILADLGDLDALLRCVGGLHQFLARPCDARRLLTVLERAFTLELWLPNQTVRKLLGRLPSLPSAAVSQATTLELLDQQDLEATAQRIADDPPLAAKILQLANSAAWGPPLDEADPKAAAIELGLANLRRTLLLAHRWSSLRDARAVGFDYGAFQHHARRTASLARRIAEMESASETMVEQAAVAGLLHNLGKLALAVNLPDKFGEAMRLQRERHLTLWEAEQGVFGATHGEVGGSLLTLWGLPMPVIEAVAFHHHPACFLSREFSPLTAVHAANVFVTSPDLESAQARLDPQYLAMLGLEDRVPSWWECQAEDTDAEVKP